MNNGRRVVISFLVATIVYFLIMLTLAFIVGFILYTIGKYNNEPLSQGLCPSVGLNKTFLLKDLDMLIERYQIYLQEETGTPQFYDRVKELIEENYTLIGDKYYYNMYLESGIIPLEKIDLVIFILIDFFLFAASLISLFQSKLRCHDNKIALTKPFAIGMIITSIISLNIYALYKYIKGYKEL